LLLLLLLLLLLTLKLLLLLLRAHCCRCTCDCGHVVSFTAHPFRANLLQLPLVPAAASASCRVGCCPCLCLICDCVHGFNDHAEV
jgi:hypothetical protein